MSESALSVNYKDIVQSLSIFLGYGASVSGLTSEKRDEIDSYISAGIRQFYYPPAVKGVETGYGWSFLQPTATIETTADDVDQDLTDDFGRLVGNIYFEPEVSIEPILLLTQGRILRLRQHSTDSARPRYATIRAKEQTAGQGSRYEVCWWPTPDDAYTLTYQYEAYQGKLSEDNPYPLGGMKHSELIVESCLAIAEQRANDELGLHTEAFYRMLAAGVEQDRKMGGRFFGPMGAAPDEPLNVPRRDFGSTYEITYKGSTW